MKFMLLVYFSLAILCAGVAFAGEKTLKEKDFTLSAVNAAAKDTKFKDIAASKLILVDFWASWCGPCKESLPHHDELQKKYKAKKLLVLAVNEDDSVTDRDAFLKGKDLSFPIYWDQGQKWISLFDVEAIPTAILFDSKMNVLEVFRGSSPAKLKALDAAIEKNL